MLLSWLRNPLNFLFSIMKYDYLHCRISQTSTNILIRSTDKTHHIPATGLKYFTVKFAKFLWRKTVQIINKAGTEARGL